MTVFIVTKAERHTHVRAHPAHTPKQTHKFPKHLNTLCCKGCRSWTTLPTMLLRQSTPAVIKRSKVMCMHRKLEKAHCRTYMLSQNLVLVLGLSWFRRWRNHRWIFLTSQSSCLDKPSNWRASGHWNTKTQEMSGKKLLKISSIFIYIPSPSTWIWTGYLY